MTLMPKKTIPSRQRTKRMITWGTESLLGLVDYDDKAKKSIKRVGVELRDRLDTAEQNIRLFLAIKAILDAAAGRFL